MPLNTTQEPTPRVLVDAQEALTQESFRELDTLFNRLTPVLIKYRNGECEWHEVVSYLQKFGHLRSDIIAAQTVVGMMSPFLPDVQDNPRQIELGIKALVGGLLGRLKDGDRWRFARKMNKAVNWLKGRGFTTDEELQKIPRQAEREAAKEPSTIRAEALQKLINDSVRSGESEGDFRKRLKKELNLRKGQEKTLVRTQGKRAYIKAQRAMLLRPEVRERYPYVIVLTVPDDRRRPHHGALDFQNTGRAVRIGSEEYNHVLEVHGEYNCRCSVRAVTPAQARKLGLKVDGELSGVELHAHVRRQLAEVPNHDSPLSDAEMNEARGQMVRGTRKRR